MAGGGYYPIMSDWEERYAPWNEPKIEYETCPYCSGGGGVWFDEDGNEYSEQINEELEFEKCEHCEGSGLIEYGEF